MKLYHTPIHKLNQMRASGETSTVEIVQSMLKRIEETEEQIHSYLSLDSEKTLAKAQEADQKLSNKETVGPLEGMPISIKDIFAAKGTKTTCASKYLENFVAPYDSGVCEKLNEAGYALTGKTNMDEFAMGSSTENSAFGVTRNPWDLSKVPGGSSGGSASCVAAGQALASIGTDTGGSIRQPASFNGIVGLKPTYGRVSRWGMVAFASSLDQAGPMTQDVTDAALILNAIAGYDARDSTSANIPTEDFTAHLGGSLKGKKVGVIKELDLASADSEVVQIYESNLKVMQAAGAEIIEVSIPNIRHAVATYYVIAPCEASSNLGRYDGIRYGHRSTKANNLTEVYELSRDEALGQEVKLRVLLGTFALSAGYYDAYYLKALKVQNLIRSQYKAAFQLVDTIASPVFPTPAFPLGERVGDPLKSYLADAFTIPANLAGIPGISVPGGFAGNLPVGIQLLGDHFSEAKLLGLAHSFEQELNLEKPSLAI